MDEITQKNGHGQSRSSEHPAGHRVYYRRRMPNDVYYVEEHERGTLVFHENREAIQSPTDASRVEITHRFGRGLSVTKFTAATPPDRVIGVLVALIVFVTIVLLGFRQSGIAAQMWGITPSDVLPLVVAGIVGFCAVGVSVLVFHIHTVRAVGYTTVLDRENNTDTDSQTR